MSISCTYLSEGIPLWHRTLPGRVVRKKKKKKDLDIPEREALGALPVTEHISHLQLKRTEHLSPSQLPLHTNLTWGRHTWYQRLGKGRSGHLLVSWQESGREGG